MAALRRRLLGNEDVESDSDEDVAHGVGPAPPPLPQPGPQGQALVPIRAGAGGDVQSEPDRYWEDPSAHLSCVERFVGHLKERLTLRLPRRFQVRFGTDCSGADCPAVAWQEISNALKAHGIQCELVQEFASECPRACHAHKFLANNGSAKVLFADLTKRATRAGPIVWSRSMEGVSEWWFQSPEVAARRHELPPTFSLQNYHSSFCCQALSTRNNGRQGVNLAIDPNEINMDGESNSTVTLVGSVRTILQLSPRTFSLENVSGCGTEQLLGYLDQHLGNQYLVLIHALNAADFTCTTSRQRVHVLGARRAAVLEPPETWSALLDSLKSSRSENKASIWMAHDSPEVVNEMERMLKFRVDKIARRQQQRAAGAPPPPEPHNLKWHKEHTLFRSWLLQRFPQLAQTLAPEPLTEAQHDAMLLALHQMPPGDRVGQSWGPLYSVREHDLILLVTAFIEVNNITSNVCVDISEQLSQTKLLADGLAPVFLRHHRYFNFSRCRHMMGPEMMRSLGFGPSTNYTGLSNGDIVRLAGNSMSVHAQAALLSVLLSCVDFAKPVETLAAPSPQQANWRHAICDIPPHQYNSPQLLHKIDLLSFAKQRGTALHLRRLPQNIASLSLYRKVKHLSPHDLPPFSPSGSSSSQTDSLPALASAARDLWNCSAELPGGRGIAGEGVFQFGIGFDLKNPNKLSPAACALMADASSRAASCVASLSAALAPCLSPSSPQLAGMVPVAVRLSPLEWGSSISPFPCAQPVAGSVLLCFALPQHPGQQFANDDPVKVWAGQHRSAGPFAIGPFPMDVTGFRGEPFLQTGCSCAGTYLQADPQARLGWPFGADRLAWAVPVPPRRQKVLFLSVLCCPAGISADLSVRDAGIFVTCGFLKPQVSNQPKVAGVLPSAREAARLPAVEPITVSIPPVVQDGSSSEGEEGEDDDPWAARLKRRRIGRNGQ